jgi:lipid-A-disaccharide synthase
MFSILPFEVPFYQKHQYPIYYIGNPSAEEVTIYRSTHQESFETFAADNHLSGRPIIALLAGSRRQEIKDNLPDMLQTASSFADYETVLAGAPGIDATYYENFIKGSGVRIVYDQTYRVLSHASAALVTSGTATLETALFNVPQVVCYHTPLVKLIAFLRKHLLKVKYISLVNLIVDRELVKELVAETMTIANMQFELERLLHDKLYRTQMLNGYEEMSHIIGKANASQNAATQMIKCLTQK